MKVNFSLIKYIYGNSLPYKMNNNSENITNADSPIKVRKRYNTSMNDKSLELFKFYKKSNHFKKINFYIYISKNLNKYNSYPFYFYIKISNQLLFNFPNHLVSTFKDNLIWNENYDYFKNYYLLNKSNELLPKIGNYYQTYTLFIPVYFPLKDIKGIISKYIKNKMKILEMTVNDNDNKEELKEIDKKIIDNNTNTKMNIKENNNDKEKVKIESFNENKKLINSGDIKTENSFSVSNYFGLDSMIKFKENSNFGGLNNFENQILNYSLLNKIKTEHKNLKNKDKEKGNLDFSLELASIIQSFEENEKNYMKKNRTPNSNSYNNQQSKIFSNNTFISNITNYKTNINFYNKEQKSKLIQDTPLENKFPINFLNLKTNPNFNINFSARKDFNILNYTKNKYKKISQKKRKNKINDFYTNLHLTLNSDNYNQKNKPIKELIYNEDEEKYGNICSNTENNLNNIYNSYKLNKKNNNNNNNCYFLYKKNKLSFSIKEKDINNDIEKRKKKLYKKIIKNPKTSITYNIIKNNKNNVVTDQNLTQRKINHRNNLTLSIINKTNFKKEKEKDNNKRCLSSFLNTKRKNIVKNKKEKSERSQSHNLKNCFSNIYWKKIIIVNKKPEKKYSKSVQKYNIKKNSFSSSYKTLNKIIVNKKENLTQKIKNNKKLNTTKNKNSIKKNLTHYKSFIENEYKAFIPKTIIKKMFFDKIKNDKIKKIDNKNKCTPLKKRNISSKNSQISYSSSNSKNINKKDNFNKIIEINDPLTTPKIKGIILKNQRSLTEFNKLIIPPKTEVRKPLRTIEQKRKKNMSFSLISKSLNLINKINFFKKINTNNGKNINNKVNKTLKKFHELNIKNNNNMKKSFVNKNSFLINVNIYNDFKIKQANRVSNTPLRKNDVLNNSLKSSYINKNKIHYLIKNVESCNQNNNNINRKKHIKY